jgi:hypothetical protein
MPSAVGVWLSHYAHRTWPHLHRGDLHLHGHSHGSLPAVPSSLDVGVQNWVRTPVTLAQIQAQLAELLLGPSNMPFSPRPTEDTYEVSVVRRSENISRVIQSVRACLTASLS